MGPPIPSDRAFLRGGGDSGGPEFIDGLVGSVNPCGLSLGPNFGDDTFPGLLAAAATRRRRA